MKKKLPELQKGQVTIAIDKTSVSNEFTKYIVARGGNPLNAGGAIGYVKAIIDQNVQDEKLREGIFNDLQQYIAEHFWAGVYTAKTHPEKVKISYKDPKAAQKKENVHTYLG
ncbi:MAG: hypothetical protein ABIA93_07610 [Candidatus Woesearchaeota archaeon]